MNTIAILLASSDARDEELPNPKLDASTHGMAAAIPAVPVANDAHEAGARSPDSEANSLDVIHRADVRPHEIIDVPT